jgi:hypothetical protein
LFALPPLKALEGLMTPAPAGEEPEQGRGQPFVPLFSGRRVLVVVFNERRSIELNPAAGAEKRRRDFGEP